jgi:hypothetical protein
VIRKGGLILRKLKRVSLILLAFFLAVGSLSMPSYAKKKSKKSTKKKVVVRKIRNLGFTTKTKRADKKAITVLKGKTSLKFRKSGHGYVKFVAPKDSVYKIKIYDLKKHKRHHLPYAYCCLMVAKWKNPKLLVPKKAETYGGKTHTLYFDTKNIDKGSEKYRYRKKRYAWLKLKAGQTLYIYCSAKSNDSFKLKIKRVNLLPSEKKAKKKAKSKKK